MFALFKRLGFTAIMLSFLGLGCDEKDTEPGIYSVFWKLEYEGRTSWILGTIHAPYRAFGKIPEPVKNGIAGSRIFLSEIEPDETSQVKIMKGMLLPDNESLEDRIGKKRFARLKSITDKFDPPISAVFLNKNKIWAASLIIAWPRRSNDPVPMDVLLYEKAKLQGCETKGLETPEEQLAPLDSFNETEQMQLLVEAMDEAEDNYNMLNSLMQKYLSQDLPGMAEDFYSRKTAFTLQFREKFVQKLLKDRNKLFFERALPYLKEKECFVAVGAGHLIGETGLISRLEKEGFKATPVEIKFEIPIQDQIPKLFNLFRL